MHLQQLILWRYAPYRSLKIIKNIFKRYLKTTIFQWYRALNSAINQTMATTSITYYKYEYQQLVTSRGPPPSQLAPLSQDFGHVINIEDESHHLVCDLLVILKNWNKYFFFKVSGEEDGKPIKCCLDTPHTRGLSLPWRCSGQKVAINERKPWQCWTNAGM